MWDKHWSEQVAKQAVWLSGLVTFEEAERILGQVGGLVMSDSSVWRRVAVWGERFRGVEATQRALADGGGRTAEAATVPGKMGVALDGATVHVRGEGWKELKVGCVFDVVLQPTWDRQSEEWVDTAHAVRASYVAHLGGPERFGQVLWTAAQRRGWTQARDTIALGDGAAWIWNLVSDQFYDSRQAVDWYHASQHLWQVAHGLHAAGSPAAQAWYRAHETLLFQGHADRIAARLRQAAHTHPQHAEMLRREAGYFGDNRRRMQYQSLHEDGWPIGSGVVESACKQFRHRFAGSGMRWSRPGIERLLPIRAAVLGHAFDAMWSAAYSSPPN
ncbi:MAG: hypothetical protein KatS3mg053_1806 [Candidatus Roseilinea sp.]|nr:MAG: hypothetical protein KatS3mg053_1254 [Candidatus Roseilinea sp.]BCX03868.1 MAG: hypothetical protein KatS3mg053_1806 [Candidatus Roseilinea sp.]